MFIYLFIRTYITRTRYDLCIYYYFMYTYTYLVHNITWTASRDGRWACPLAFSDWPAVERGIHYKDLRHKIIIYTCAAAVAAPPAASEGASSAAEGGKKLLVCDFFFLFTPLCLLKVAVQIDIIIYYTYIYTL